MFKILKSALIALTFLSFTPCNAQGLPPEPGSDATKIPAQTSTSTAPDSNSVKKNSIELIDIALPPDENTSPKPPVETKSVVDGPLKSQRQALYNQIQTAQQSGVGIKNYMMAFDYIEKMAKDGAEEAAIKKRMVPLITALSSQLKNKEELKTRPSPSQMQAQQGMPSGEGNGLLAPGQQIPPGLGMFGGLGGAHTADLINRIVKNKNIDPKKLPKNLPGGIDKSFLNNKLKDPRIQEMLKKYQNR